MIESLLLPTDNNEGLHANLEYDFFFLHKDKGFNDYPTVS